MFYGTLIDPKSLFSPINDFPSQRPLSKTCQNRKLGKIELRTGQCGLVDLENTEVGENCWGAWDMGEKPKFIDHTDTKKMNE